MPNVLRTYIKKILLEGQFENRIEQAKSSKKFAPYSKQIDQLVQGLTTSGLKNVGYLNWGLKQIQDARVVELDTIANEILSVVTQFDQMKGGLTKKDIMQWKSLGELRGALEQRAQTREKRSARGNEMRKMASEADQNLEKAIKESEMLVGGTTPEEIAESKILLIHPHTKFASQYWGNPTEFACDISIAQGYVRWCTAATRSDNYFNDYSGRNVHLYYIIDKRKDPTDEYYKIAYALYDDGYSKYTEIFDTEDDRVSESNVQYNLGNDVWYKIRTIIDEHYATSPGTQRVRDKVEAQKSQSPDRLMELAKSSDPEVRRRVVNNPNTPPEALIQLASDPNLDVLQTMAWAAESRELSIPLEAIKILARNESENIRTTIARSDILPVEVFDILVDDPSSKITQIIAARHAPPHILDKLSEHEDYVTRVRVASSSNVSVETLMKMLKRTSWQYGGSMYDLGVDVSIAKNPNVTPEMLRILSTRKDEYEVLDAVAENEKTPPDVLDNLSTSEDSDTRAWIASNPSTPVSTLVNLSKDPEEDVRQHVARNKNTPPNILIRLAKEKRGAIRYAVGNNPNSPKKALEIVAKTSDSYGNEARRRLGIK